MIWECGSNGNPRWLQWRQWRLLGAGQSPEPTIKCSAKLMREIGRQSSSARCRWVIELCQRKHAKLCRQSESQCARFMYVRRVVPWTGFLCKPHVECPHPQCTILHILPDDKNTQNDIYHTQTHTTTHTHIASSVWLTHKASVGPLAKSGGKLPIGKAGCGENRAIKGQSDRSDTQAQAERKTYKDSIYVFVEHKHVFSYLDGNIDRRNNNNNKQITRRC